VVLYKNERPCFQSLKDGKKARAGNLQPQITLPQLDREIHGGSLRGEENHESWKNARLSTKKEISIPGKIG